MKKYVTHVCCLFYLEKTPVNAYSLLPEYVISVAPHVVCITRLVSWY